ncbi:MAG: selenocysteine-specific translation elongation factor [Candidatus Tectimicrobiota bacterium]
MKQIVLGTAGHIDHGKTSLIKALTDIDTDRLKEEKERGITIDLGFAFLNLTDDIQLGIVDVPGHERFVKNMLAGVGGIDLVVLVIAADEGVMPQTREHLAICELLRVREGLVALTKIDMVDADWLELVQEDTAEFLRGTFLEGKPIVPVSSKTGAGLDVLLDTLRTLCQSLTPRSTTGPMRLPIDRVFTMRGFGVVVTGTLFSGSLRLEDRVEMLPAHETARVRGIQVHNHSVPEAMAGQRTAINLQGLEKAEIQRGHVLITPGRFPVTYMLDVTLTLLHEAPRPLKHRDHVRFHIGTSEIMGRVILLDRDEVQPGEEVFAQLHLEEPTVAASQDRYVLRSYSPVQTIAGGTILDALPAKHRRRRPQVLEQLTILRDGTAAEVLAVHLRHADYHGLQWADFLLRSPLDDTTLRGIVTSLQQEGIAVVIEENPPWLLHRESHAQACAQILALVADFHRLNPLKPAMFTEELRSKFPDMPDKVFTAIVQGLVTSGELEVTRDKVKLRSHTVTLSPTLQAAIDALERTFLEAAYQPPSVEEALEHHKLTRAEDRELLQVLVDQHKLIRLKGDIFYHRDIFSTIEQQLRLYLEQQGEISAAEFRDLLQISRKYAIPLLEHFDNQRLTMRVGDKRILRKAG